MENHDFNFIDKFSIAIAIFIFLILPIIGHLSEALKSPKPKQEWLPRIDPRATENNSYVKPKTIKPRRQLKPAWHKDKQAETQEWLDFKEEIENKGLRADDWEALEIWDSEYQ